ncbi:hypothetical protein Taro_055612 [Colocasia esculenta]|uniref:protein disulfide-isomerase n=1 Tax=Colocasia esculenta TaxID=4460 RepID=A0A843XU71_COLES|nr:hypothetical protein [Colocasia esculenta]
MAIPRPSRFAPFLLLLLALSAILLSHASAAADPKKSTDLDDDEDLSFLEESDDGSPPGHDHLYGAGHNEDEEDADEDLEEFDPSAHGGYAEPPPTPAVDDKDVVVLTDGNFSEFLVGHRHVMVEFYAPWCGHCQALAPEYAAAATELKAAAEDVVLAKVDATEETELAQKYEIQGFPTVLFFVGGEDNHKPYPAQRTKLMDSPPFYSSQPETKALTRQIARAVYIQVLMIRLPSFSSSYASAFSPRLWQITVDTDRTVVAFYKFIKKHASIPFKLQKPASAAKSESASSSPAAESKIETNANTDLKDEL